MRHTPDRCEAQAAPNSWRRARSRGSRSTFIDHMQRAVVETIDEMIDSEYTSILANLVQMIFSQSYQENIVSIIMSIL